MARLAPGPTISPREHHEWAVKIWRRIDRRQTGRISRKELDCEEFRTVMRSVLAPAAGTAMGGATYARAEINTKQAIGFCLRKADLNNDKSLSFEEFESFMMCLRQEHLAKHTANLIFALFDLNGDKKICEPEFREIYRFFLGHTPTEAEFQSEWARLDTAGMQEVTLDGFIKWLRTSPNPIFRQHAPPEEAEQEESAEAAATSPVWGSCELSQSQLRSNLAGSKLTLSSSLPRLRRSRSTVSDRPQWNQRFNAGVSASAPQAHRNYFSRPQSLPELVRHYETHRGFRDHLERLRTPEPRRKQQALSTDIGYEMLPERALPGGLMRNPATGKRQPWEDHWQKPRCLQSFYQPGTLDLRCPGPPPKSLYSDDDDDW